MKTFNEGIQDELTSHFIFVLKYISELQKRYSRTVVSYNEPLSSLISSHLSSLKTRNVGTRQWRDFEIKLKKLRSEMVRNIESDFSKESSEFRKKELRYIMGMMSELSPIIHNWQKPQLPEKNTELILGSTIPQRFQIIENSDVRRMILKIKSMYLSGYDPSAILTAVIGVAGFQYVGSAVGQTISYVKTNIQTMISGLSEEVLHQFSTANDDVIQYEVFVAVLDSKTTEQCAESDGSFWKLDEGLFPPLHENCRSRRYPLINGVAFVEGRYFYMRDGEEYIKMSLVGKDKDRWIENYIGGVPKKYNYEQFLRRQPLSFQEKVLGKTKAKLFNSGELSLKNFIDSSGRSLTLKELSSLYGDSFLAVNMKNMA
jgi:hypothetical protein